MNRSRRTFVRQAAIGGAGLLTFMVGGRQMRLTPAQARAAQLPFRTLGGSEVRTLDALGEVLLPGSAASGLAHYIDQQLSGPPAASMLMIKYLGVRPPFADFYKGALKGLDAAARAQGPGGFGELSVEAARALVGRMAAGEVAGWSGPPAGLCYFVLRSDAIDVVYGTPEGFAVLGVPYMAHIHPPARWGE